MIVCEIDITNEYTKGKINKEQFDKLVDEISINYREIFKNQLNYIDNLSEHDKENRVTEIKRDIEDVYAKGKLNELHYKLLKENISNYEK